MYDSEQGLGGMDTMMNQTWLVTHSPKYYPLSAYYVLGTKIITGDTIATRTEGEADRDYSLHTQFRDSLWRERPEFPEYLWQQDPLRWQSWDGLSWGKDVGTGHTALPFNSGNAKPNANGANTSCVPGSQQKGAIWPGWKARVSESCGATAFSGGLHFWRKGPAHWHGQAHTASSWPDPRPEPRGWGRQAPHWLARFPTIREIYRKWPVSLFLQVTMSFCSSPSPCYLKTCVKNTAGFLGLEPTQAVSFM